VAAKTGRHLLAARREAPSEGLPSRSSFTPKEWAIIRTHRTPQQVQRFIDLLHYNREKPKETCRSFRSVIAKRTAHCLEAAITAAIILEQYGYPPLMLSLESADQLDHILYLFKQKGRWGAIGRSREAGRHGRKPVFRSVRDLMLSYVEPYVDYTGRITGYGVGNLYAVDNCDWRFSPKNVWKVEKYLIKMPHKKYRMAKRRYQQVLRRYKAFRAAHPKAPVNYYDSRPTWMGRTDFPSDPIPKKFRPTKPHYAKE
jgi:hypothetical protein